MTDKITKRQQAVLDVIEQYIREKGFGPTVREVCQALGLSSPSTVHVHLKALEEKGLIKRDALKSRSIALTYPLDHTEDATNIVHAQFDDIVSVPLVGDVAAGVPILAEQNIESYIGVPAAWRADFALTCHGDSMSPTICDGDIVCIRCQPEVEQGEIAAVRIGEEATLKHFHRQGDTVMLLADNAAVCPPMVYTGPQLNEIRIEGKAVGFCRGL